MTFAPPFFSQRLEESCFYQAFQASRLGCFPYELGSVPIESACQREINIFIPGYRMKQSLFINGHGFSRWMFYSTKTEDEQVP